jgi:hypothetical protein
VNQTANLKAAILCCTLSLGALALGKESLPPSVETFSDLAVEATWVLA